MKIIWKVLIVIFVVLNYSCSIQRPLTRYQGYDSNQQGSGYIQPGPVSYQVFYDQLSPYGQWTDYQDYGYIWIPNAGRDFFPYSTAGHWVMTEYGWTWLSDYPWGWAAFHYGRWDFDNYYGWFWVPGNEWGPAWVTWRRANGYYGWAPMSTGININIGSAGGYRDMDRWSFVSERDFGRSDIQRRQVNRRDNELIFKNSTVINNTYFDKNRNETYISGPRADEVQRVTGRRINSVAIRDNDRPGEKMNNSRLQIYRPRVERIDNGRQKPVPSRITNPGDIRPAGDGNAGYQKSVTPSDNKRRGVEQQTQPRQQTNSQRQDRNIRLQQSKQNEAIRKQPQQKNEARVLRRSAKKQEKVNVAADRKKRGEK